MGPVLGPKICKGLKSITPSKERVKDKYGQIFTFTKEAKMNLEFLTAVQNLMNYRNMIDSLHAFKQ